MHDVAVASMALALSAGIAVGAPPSPERPKLDLGVMALPGLLGDEPATDAAPDLPDGADPRPAASIFAWLLSVKADTGIDGFETSIDMEFSDILDNLRFAGFVEVGLVGEGWVLRVAGMYSKLEIDGAVEYRGSIERDFGFTKDVENPVLRRIFGDQIGFEIELDVPTSAEVRVETELDLAITQALLGRRLVGIPLDKAPPNRFTKRPATLEVIPYAGMRMTYLRLQTDVDVTASIGPVTRSQSFSVNGSKLWLDPLIGVDVALVNLDRWSLGARADIGGFNIGDSSKLTWSAGGRVVYSVSETFFIYAGYFILDYDYDDSGFTFDGYFHGPTLGGVLTF